jgi:hypothetical protein
MNFVEKLAYFGILAAVFAVIDLNARKFAGPQAQGL